MKFTTNKHFNKGYTIIETMIAIALFLVIMLYGMNALLSANLLDRKSQDMRSIMDNLSFILEDISRNARTGYNYHCSNNISLVGLDVPQSCVLGGILAFEEAHGNSEEIDDQWVYKIESTGFGLPYNISKSVDGGVTFVQLNSSEIVLQSMSGFSVLGAEPPLGDTQQPLLIIRLIGEIHYKDIITPFSLQTSVSQRLIDINI